jgi:hypothetical protein
MFTSMRKPGLTVLPIALLSVAPAARAQEADHADRGDVSDFREHEDGRPEPYEYRPDGTPGPSWSLDIGAPLLFDTNPFWAADGSHDALLATPSLALAYSHPQLIPGWDLALSAEADADIYSRDPEELNEARLTAAATIFHQVGNAGTLSFGFRQRWSYIGEDFSDFDQSQQRYIVMFAPNFPGSVSASVSAEYRDSSQASQRRAIGTVNFDWTMLDSEHVRLGFFQEFAFSHFTAGANDGRDDLLSLSEVMLTPQLNLPPGMRLGVAATLFHRFSNREASRFTGVQVGPSLGFRF